MTLEERLLNIKKINDEKKVEKAKLEGRLETLSRQVKEQYGCNSIQELEQKITALDKQIVDITSSLTEQISELEKILGIDNDRFM